MLSALIKRVKSLEKKLEIQTSELVTIKNKFSDPYPEIQSVSSVNDVNKVLLTYQGKFREQGFEMNKLRSMLTNQEDNIHKMKLDLFKMRNNEKKNNTVDDLYNTEQFNFTYCKELTSASNLLGYSNKDDFSPLLLGPEETEERDNMVANYSNDLPLEGTSEEPSMGGWESYIANQIHIGVPVITEMDIIMQQQYQQFYVQPQPLQQTMNNNKGQQQHKQQYGSTISQRSSTAHVVELAKKISEEACTILKSTSSSESVLALHKDLAHYKAQVLELEADCEQKDKLIKSLASKEEDFMKREKEFLQKLEWCEHKMRLLKQDKKRRGDTIGKLLKSIDEMKDSGKINLKKVKEGKGILMSTLNSHGLSTDQRIRAAVLFTESEKSPRHREAIEACASESGHSCSDYSDQETIEKQQQGVGKQLKKTKYKRLCLE